jgi:hypothetical protein
MENAQAGSMSRRETEISVRIHWIRVLIVGFISEIVLFALDRLVSLLPPGPLNETLEYLNWFGLMFLGGLWIARKIESGFVLHGALVGIAANILIVMLMILGTILGQLPDGYWIAALPPFAIKIVGSTAGAFIGGIRRKRQLSAQAKQSPI